MNVIKTRVFISEWFSLDFYSFQKYFSFNKQMAQRIYRYQDAISETVTAEMVASWCHCLNCARTYALRNCDDNDSKHFTWNRQYERYLFAPMCCKKIMASIYPKGGANVKGISGGAIKPKRNRPSAKKERKPKVESWLDDMEAKFEANKDNLIVPIFEWLPSPQKLLAFNLARQPIKEELIIIDDDDYHCCKCEAK